MTIARGLFQVEPQPIIISRFNTVLSWSPKSGCSHAILWAFLQEGLFYAANYYHGWPHNFRMNVYYRSVVFQAALDRFLASDGAGYTLLKVTRDPKKRLVSIFRHVCRYGFLADQVRRVLGFDMTAEGLSLADLDAVLGSMDLVTPSRADPHVRAQYHPVWSVPFDRVITLNLDETPLNAGLNAVEGSLGMPVTNFARYQKFDRLREAHYAREGEFAGEVPVERYRFRAEETPAFPKQALLRSALLESMARRHYAVDYGLVDSADTAGELFRPEARAALG
jgi:hypothetical protein